MGCTPSKSNAVHPISSLGSAKANGSLPENSSATVNGTSNDQQFATETTKGLDESSPNQSNCNEQQNQISNKLKELENVNTSSNSTNTTAAAINIAPACDDSHQLSCAVNNALQHHGNHEYHVLGNQPPLSIPKLPNPKIASLRTSLRGPGTESQIEFFKMLDRKIEAGPDFKDN